MIITNQKEKDYMKSLVGNRNVLKCEFEITEEQHSKLKYIMGSNSIRAEDYGFVHCLKEQYKKEMFLKTYDAFEMFDRLDDIYNRCFDYYNKLKNIKIENPIMHEQIGFLYWLCTEFYEILEGE